MCTRSEQGSHVCTRAAFHCRLGGWVSEHSQKYTSRGAGKFYNDAPREARIPIYIIPELFCLRERSACVCCIYMRMSVVAALLRSSLSRKVFFFPVACLSCYSLIKVSGRKRKRRKEKMARREQRVGKFITQIAAAPEDFCPLWCRICRSVA